MADAKAVIMLNAQHLEVRCAIITLRRRKEEAVKWRIAISGGVRSDRQLIPEISISHTSKRYDFNRHGGSRTSWTVFRSWRNPWTISKDIPGTFNGFRAS